MDAKIREFISISVTARVFVFCRREAISDHHEIRRYQKLVREHLQALAESGADLPALQQALQQQLDSLLGQVIAHPPHASGNPAGNTDENSPGVELPLSEKSQPDWPMLLDQAVELGLLTGRQSRNWQLQLQANPGNLLEQGLLEKLRSSLLARIRHFLNKNRRHSPWQSREDQQLLFTRISQLERVSALIALTQEIIAQIDAHQSGRSRLFRRLGNRLPW